MKPVKIYWTPFALKCLEEIKDYIQKETWSENVANRYILKLISKVELLEHSPEAGAIEEMLRHLGQNSRYLIEGNYKIIYQLESDKVIVTDVFHTKQNPIKIIKRNKRK